MPWYDKIAPKYVENLAVAYFQDFKFSPFAVFPKVTVGQSSGYIAKYEKRDWLYIGDPDSYIRMGATESKGDTYQVGKQPYVIYPRAFHDDVTKEDVEDYDNPFDPIEDSILYVTSRLDLVLCQLFVNQYLVDGVWGNEKDGSGTDFTQWNQTGSDPVKDILTWKGEVKSVTGFEPNRLLVTNDVYIALRTNSAVKDQLKVTDDKVVTSEALKRLMDLEELVVLDAVKTTAKKGETVTSSNTGFLASGKALLVYAPDRPSKKVPSGGYHLADKKGGGIEVRTIPMPHLNDALRIEATFKVEPILVASDLGTYAKNVIA